MVILNDLDYRRRRNYRELTAALSRRFSPAHQTQLFQAMLKNSNPRKVWQNSPRMSND
ncbi:hypothetical protein HOLleu_25638 [Holothuria leucospilota]|uniref:Uncharacterized protein n=1 Tax=Holothuria leucospilota TaxID=206669 RepID=A0A9Q1BSX9_HOLLE|nr:hypothetical protein HOLleu_25638 [Holothuria leucospilota]